MRVVHIIQRYPPAIGGTETWCRNLSRYLASHGIITEVATINLFDIEEFFKSFPDEKQGIKLGEYDFDSGVWIRRFKLWSFADKSFSVYLIRFLLDKLHLYRTEVGATFQHSPHSFQMYCKLKNMVRNADIIHLHTLPYFHNLVGFVIAKLYGKKIVITPHFHPDHMHYERKIFYRMMNSSDAVLAMTEYEKNYLVEKGVVSSKVSVIGNSIDTENFISKDKCFEYARQISEKYKIRPDSKKIIFIGRKELYKGIFTLFEAAEKLALESKEEIIVFLVGPDSIEFNNKQDKMSYSSRIRIIDFGPVDDEEKEKLISFSDVLVLHSEFEAFGIVFLEAWKYKKPVIGSDRGAIPEVIKNAGLCSLYGNSVDLKEKLKKILYDPQLAQRYGEAGKQKLDREFSLNKIGEKVLHIYRNLTPNGKKVLIVSNLFPPHAKGGAEVVAYQQARVLKRMGFDINIFAGSWNVMLPRFLTTSKKGEFKITRINLHDIDFDRRSINFDKKEIIKEFNKLLFSYAPDIVHFHNISSMSMKMVDECHAKGTPTVMTLHDYWGVCPKNIFITDARSLCDKKTLECVYCNDFFFVNEDHSINFAIRNKIFMEHLNRLDLVISPSAYLLNRFRECGLDQQKGVVINNGIDLSRFRIIKKTVSSKVRFAFIGQILEHKGLEILLKSIALLGNKEKAKISLFIIGSGEGIFFRFCKDLTKELGLMDVIKFMGEVSNARIPKVLSEIDVLVVPSIWPENSPVTIMEALASGTPVLSSDVGGIPELIQDGVNGYLHRYNEPESLVRNIRRIIERPQIVEEMRQACFKKAKEYDLESQVKIIVKHYDGLINSKIK